MKADQSTLFRSDFHLAKAHLFTCAGARLAVGTGGSLVHTGLLTQGRYAALAAAAWLAMTLQDCTSGMWLPAPHRPHLLHARSLGFLCAGGCFQATATVRASQTAKA